MDGGHSAEASFAEVFRAALEARGLTLSAVKRMLEDRGVSVALATLSYWRSASRQPDAEKRRSAIIEVESILELEPGALLSLAARPRVIDTVASQHPDGPGDDDEHRALLSEASRVLGLPSEDDLRELSQMLIVDVGVDGYPVRETIRTMMQCIGDSLDRVGWLVPMQWGGAHAVKVTVLSGIDAGHWIDPGDRLHAVAIDLDPPLKQGDTVMLEVRSDFLDGARTEMGSGIFENQRAQKIVNWVRFHPDAVPDWFLETEATSEGETRLLRGLDAPSSIHQARWDFGPGGIRLDWGYGEAPDLLAPDGA